MVKTKSAIEMTARWVDRLPLPQEGRVEFFDANVRGLGLRVSASGHRSWFLMYRVRGDSRVRRLTIGTYPQTSLANARDEARKALSEAHSGKDPAAPARALQEAP